MENTSTLFNRAGTRLARTFAKHAGKFASLLSNGGNLWMVAKRYIQHAPPSNRGEQIMGGIFFGANLLFPLTDRYPKMKKAIGVAYLMGSAAWGWAGWSQPDSKMQLASAAVIGVQSLCMIFEEQIRNGGRRMQAGGAELWRTVVGAITEKPLLTGTLMTMTMAYPAMIHTAIARPDLLMLPAIGVWLAGDTSIICTDDSVRAALSHRGRAGAQPKTPHIS